MKLIKKLILSLSILIAVYLWYLSSSIENMTPLDFDNKNKEYMDMLISVTSIFGGIFLIVAIMAISTPITNSNVPISKLYSSRLL